MLKNCFIEVINDQQRNIDPLRSKIGLESCQSPPLGFNAVEARKHQTAVHIKIMLVLKNGTSELH